MSERVQKFRYPNIKLQLILILNILNILWIFYKYLMWYRTIEIWNIIEYISWDLTTFRTALVHSENVSATWLVKPVKYSSDFIRNWSTTTVGVFQKLASKKRVGIKYIVCFVCRVLCFTQLHGVEWDSPNSKNWWG